MTQVDIQQAGQDDNSLDAATTAASSDKFLRRNNRGCKSSNFYNWPQQPLDDMDSTLAVQQYIQQTIQKDPSDIDTILKLPDGQDLGAWKIEHLRLFCMQLNKLATLLQDCCHPETCNQMTATEQWIFLCAAHKQPVECPAIDYTRHTLDGAASLLNSNKYFPSRVTIKETSVAKLGSICRRIYRIFSHAYYHHFQIYNTLEQETHLCERFSKFVTMYDLMSKDSLIVPTDSKASLQDPSQDPATTAASSTTASTTATTTTATTSTTSSTETAATTALSSSDTTATTTAPPPASSTTAEAASSTDSSSATISSTEEGKNKEQP